MIIDYYFNILKQSNTGISVRHEVYHRYSIIISSFVIITTQVGTRYKVYYY